MERNQELARQGSKALSSLSDMDLTAEVARLARSARESTASLVGHLAEFEGRRLHLAAGFNSLFFYCVQVLRLSEHEAYNRIEAARAARKHPAILDRLASGDLNLTGVRLLAPHLTEANHLELLLQAAGKTKHEVLEVIARYFPRPDVASRVRKLPASRVEPAGLLASTPQSGAGVAVVDAAGGGPGPTVSGREVNAQVEAWAAGTKEAAVTLAAKGPTQRHSIQPLAWDRYEIRFTASKETCEKLRLAKDLLRHSNPFGDTAEIMDRALTLLLADLARKKCAATPRPRSIHRSCSGTRSIPAAVKRAVWLRDLGRCAFVGERQRRCEARGFLEFHHVRPFAVGGVATVENIEVRCRAHNAYEADLFYGRLVPERVDGGARQDIRDHG
jgi:hypothetical protein